MNIGGAVLGVAVITVITNSVTSNNGGEELGSARLDGYRAGYYAAIFMSGLAAILSVFGMRSAVIGFSSASNEEVTVPSDKSEGASSSSESPTDSVTRV